MLRNATENFIPTVLIAVGSAIGLSKNPELQDMILTLMQINHILFPKSVHLHKNREWLLLERIGVKNGFLGDFRKEQNIILNMRQKSTALCSLKLNIQTVT